MSAQIVLKNSSGKSVTLINPDSNTENIVVPINTISFDGGHDFSTNGYQKLSNGLILQWGTVSITSDGSGTTSEESVVFPLTFPNAVLSIQCTVELASGGIEGSVNAYYNTLTTSGVKLGNDSNGATDASRVNKWFAIGY